MPNFIGAFDDNSNSPDTVNPKFPANVNSPADRYGAYTVPVVIPAKPLIVFKLVDLRINSFPIFIELFTVARSALYAHSNRFHFRSIFSR